MSDEQDTPIIGRYLGLPIPRGCSMHLQLHVSTGEQFEDLVEEAARHGLITARHESGDTRWVEIRAARVGMSVFCPHGFMGTGSGAESFEEFIDRKMESLKFIEIAAPGEELSVQDRMNRVGVVS